MLRRKATSSFEKIARHRVQVAVALVSGAYSLLSSPNHLQQMSLSWLVLDYLNYISVAMHMMMGIMLLVSVQSRPTDQSRCSRSPSEASYLRQIVFQNCETALRHFAASAEICRLRIVVMFSSSAMMQKSNQLDYSTYEPFPTRQLEDRDSTTVQHHFARSSPQKLCRSLGLGAAVMWHSLVTTYQLHYRTASASQRDRSRTLLHGACTECGSRLVPIVYDDALVPTATIPGNSALSSVRVNHSNLLKAKKRI
jgi:hypothetical protein